MHQQTQANGALCQLPRCHTQPTIVLCMAMSYHDLRRQATPPPISCLGLRAGRCAFPLPLPAAPPTQTNSCYCFPRGACMTLRLPSPPHLLGPLLLGPPDSLASLNMGRGFAPPLLLSSCPLRLPRPPPAWNLGQGPWSVYRRQWTSQNIRTAHKSHVKRTPSPAL